MPIPDRLVVLSALCLAVIAVGIASGSAPSPAGGIEPSALTEDRRSAVGYPAITLAPEGALPVLTPEESKDDDLEPGRYRIRLAHQAGWPERCLDDMLVFPHPKEGEPMPVPSQSTGGDFVPEPDWRHERSTR